MYHCVIFEEDGVIDVKQAEELKGNTSQAVIGDAVEAPFKTSDITDTGEPITRDVFYDARLLSLGLGKSAATAVKSFIERQVPVPRTVSDCLKAAQDRAQHGGKRGACSKLKTTLKELTSVESGKTTQKKQPDASEARDKKAARLQSELIAAKQLASRLQRSRTPDPEPQKNLQHTDPLNQQRINPLNQQQINQQQINQQQINHLNQQQINQQESNPLNQQQSNQQQINQQESNPLNQQQINQQQINQQQINQQQINQQQINQQQINQQQINQQQINQQQINQQQINQQQINQQQINQQQSNQQQINQQQINQQQINQQHINPLNQSPTNPHNMTHTNPQHDQYAMHHTQRLVYGGGVHHGYVEIHPQPPHANLSRAVGSSFEVLDDAAGSFLELGASDSRARILQLESEKENLYELLRTAEAKVTQLEGDVQHLRCKLQQTGTQGGLTRQQENHYQPKRGMMVSSPEFEILGESASVPPGYQKLAEGGQLAVSVLWLTKIMAKTQGKSASFRIKKLIEAFVHPNDAAGIRYGNMNRHSSLGPIFVALDLFAVNQLKMSGDKLSRAFNTKFSTLRRAAGRLQISGQTSSNEI